MRKTIATAVAVCALMIASAVPASAATSGWVNGDHYTYLGNCAVKSSNYSRWAWSEEPRSCDGYVGVRAKIASGARVTYTGFKWGTRDASISLPSGVRTLSHQSAH
ncbi:hypothetical protein [Demequina sediminicola]|uniref:hypothetical protein n=1 Tax=Demequina sediminicola TaxID=1095026 RepID=UPI000ABDB825|nr:hypothetical protein [Demequina sediminicola]